MPRMPEQEAIADVAAVRQYHERMGKGPVQHEYRRLAREAVAMGVPQGAMILDVGTGPGYVAIEIARRLAGQGARVVGLDLSPAMLTVAAENAVRAGVASVVTWKRGDAKQMPFGDGTFDVVVSCGSLHHWGQPLAVFDEMARVLKPSGRCLVHDSKRLERWEGRLVASAIGLLVPRDFRVHYWHSIASSYTAAELRALLERSVAKGWRVQEDLLDLLVTAGG